MQALSIPVSNVTAASLEAYLDAAASPAKTATAKNWNATTLFIAYIPSTQVVALQDALKNSSSKLFTTQTSAVAKELTTYIDANYNILSAAGKGSNTSSQLHANSNETGNHKVRNALIGVCTALGAVLLTVLGVLGWCWKSRKNQPHKMDMHQRSPNAAAAVSSEAVHQQLQRGETIRSFGTRDVNAVGVGRAPTVRSFGLRERWELDPAEHDDLFGLSSTPATPAAFLHPSTANGRTTERVQSDLRPSLDASSSFRAYARAIQYSQAESPSANTTFAAAEPPVHDAAHAALESSGAEAAPAPPESSSPEMAHASVGMSQRLTRASSMDWSEDSHGQADPFADQHMLHRPSVSSSVPVRQKEVDANALDVPARRRFTQARHDARSSRASEWTQQSAPYTPAEPSPRLVQSQSQSTQPHGPPYSLSS